MKENIKELIEQMTLEEKAGMCSGLDFWHLKGVDRLDIPPVMVSDGPHGLRKQDDSADHLGINDSIKAVCFPPAVLSACSFDRDLLKELGQVIGQEAQATDVSVVLGPAVNIKRSPLCGRNFEYYSEDPYLAGECAAAFIEGVQSQGVGTSVKHFAANNQELNRMSCSSEVDERTLREIYLPPFEIAVKKSQPATVMCSYNRLNGTYASEHPWLLTDVLRKDWGFEGYVMSDWGAVNDRVAGLKAGLELEMPASGGSTDKEIIAAVKDGSLEESVLNQAVERILKVTFQWLNNRREEKLDLEKDHAFACHVAEESMVLLKNEGLLPLSDKEKVVFIGEFAKKPRYQGGGSSHINSFRTDNALDAAKDLAEVTYVKGFSSGEDFYDEKLAKKALLAAKDADKAVIFAGLPNSFESEGYDRSHMRLPDCQNRLIEEILAVNPNTIVVLHNGSPVEMPWLCRVGGLIEAYLGGQAAGSALVNILYGRVNPCGKLAETLPLKLSDNPSYLNFAEKEKVEYKEGVFVGYRYYDSKEMEVAFPFGHGLSYTSFAYSNLSVNKKEIKDDETLMVSVDVTNTGAREGKEIVQLYVSDKSKTCRRPVKELKGYEKISLKAGETKTVTMTLDKRSFAWFNTRIHDWYAASGEYEIQIGASSRDIRLQTCIHLQSTRLLPLDITLNTTVGELLEDERSRALGLFFKKKMDEFFSLSQDSSNLNDEDCQENLMGDAMALAMPIRGLSSFGVLSKEELQKEIDKLNKA